MKYVFLKNTNEYSKQLDILKKKYKSDLEMNKNYKVLKNHVSIDEIDTNGGYIALGENGTVNAWLKIIEQTDDLWGNSLLILAMYDLDLSEYSSVIKYLYGLEADQIKKPYYEHKVHCFAYDFNLLRVWSELGFGIEQAYGYAELNDLKEKTSNRYKVIIEEQNSKNKNDFLQFYSLIATTQAKAPTYAGVPNKYLIELKRGFEELLNNTDSIKILAFKQSKAVGYQVWFPVNENDIELSVSGTKDEERGKGIGTALTEYGVDLAIKRGYKNCFTDWRTANPFSSHFWPSIGFRPYEYRLVRRLFKPVIDDAKGKDKNT